MKKLYNKLKNMAASSRALTVVLSWVGLFVFLVITAFSPEGTLQTLFMLLFFLGFILVSLVTLIAIIASVAKLLGKPSKSHNIDISNDIPNYKNNNGTSKGDIKMGFTDIFKIGEIKARNAELENDNKELRDRLDELGRRNAVLDKKLKEFDLLLTPEHREIISLKDQIENLKQEEFSISEKISEKNKNSNELDKEIEKKKALVFDLDETIIFQDFALYKPKYNFANSEQYKEKLATIREHQKIFIKNDTAATGATGWVVNGSETQGKKLVKDTQKLLLRAFNCECDDAIQRVTYANIELSERKIRSAAESISKLGKVMSISISNLYLESKVEELYLAFEYATAKQREKEEQKEIRARMREEAKLQKEIEEARKKVEKEQTHYQNALEKLEKQLLGAKTDEERADLEAKKNEISAQLEIIDKNIKDIDYREANMKAGYVYIISNIGAFGENVFKIGMTRRLDPQERIDELGDASVPFDFDVHALIFSDDAPALEAALHRTFEDRKLNMVNHRREFFNVTLEEIKEAVRNNFDKTVEFIDIPSAEQYRTTMKMKEESSIG